MAKRERLARYNAPIPVKLPTPYIDALLKLGDDPAKRAAHLLRRDVRRRARTQGIVLSPIGSRRKSQSEANEDDVVKLRAQLGDAPIGRRELCRRLGWGASKLYRIVALAEAQGMATRVEAQGWTRQGTVAPAKPQPPQPPHRANPKPTPPAPVQPTPVKWRMKPPTQPLTKPAIRAVLEIKGQWQDTNGTWGDDEFLTYLDCPCGGRLIVSDDGKWRCNNCPKSGAAGAYAGHF